ncbi:MAG: LCP family protein [Oscillospiraceae bacterium]|nr:LCP family protein [Oscillospiraceae bacterium]
MDKKAKRLRLWLSVGGGAVAAILGVISLYMLWERPPAQSAEPNVLSEIAPGTPSRAGETARPSPTPDPGTAFATARQDGVYTFLFAGSDDGTGNTDTIMVGKLDTVRHTANFVSIPRDTCINVDTPIRKLNSVYWGAVNNGGVGSEALRRHVRKLTGFDVDCYAVIDLNAFQQTVDALGGIWYDVPERMYYDGGPVIDLQPGYQLLNGEQAMWLCRYRSGYVNGDLDRINVQHDFLKAAADQFLNLGSVPNIPAVAGILADSMDTNMTAANMAWFARQLLRCRSEDIRFETAPNTPAFVHDLSYTFLDLYDWLAMVNADLNPGAAPVTEGMLDLVYLHNGEVGCTAALQGLAYFRSGSSGASSEPAAPEPLPAEDWSAPPPQTPPPQSAPAPTEQPAAEPAPAEPTEDLPFMMPTDDDWLSFL